MRLLFDHNVDRRFRKHLIGHIVQTTREMGWETYSNGLLLKIAADNSFAAILCIDKKIEYEQNLKTLPLPIIVLDAPTNAVQDLIPFAPHVLKLLESTLEKSLYVVAQDGSVTKVTAPRPRP